METFCRMSSDSCLLSDILIPAAWVIWVPESYQTGRTRAIDRKQSIILIPLKLYLGPMTVRRSVYLGSVCWKRLLMLTLKQTRLRITWNGVMVTGVSRRHSRTGFGDWNPRRRDDKGTDLAGCTREVHLRTVGEPMAWTTSRMLCPFTPVLKIVQKC